jgi:hypothetical protein
MLPVMTTHARLAGKATSDARRSLTVSIGDADAVKLILSIC